MQFRRQRQSETTDVMSTPADTPEAAKRAAVDSRSVAEASLAQPPRRLIERPTIKVGAYAWAVIGVVAVLLVAMQVIARLSLVAIPLVIALFPAAILTPLAMRLKAQGWRDALVATVLVLGTLLIIAGIITVLVPLVAGEIDNISQQVSDGIDDLRSYLRRGPFGLPPVELSDLIQQARDRVQSANIVNTEAVGSLAEQAGRFLTGLIVFVLALFFYLKDGPAITAWLRRQFPSTMRDDASAVGDLVWTTIGSYFRGQLLVALIDATGITLGMIIMRVPLALPVGVLVFFGSLFPVVGAFISGFVAVIIALATRGPVTALIVLGIVLAVQQLEGHILQPLILGRATRLHPLAVVAALIAGGTLLGILGAFIAVPVTASAYRAISYVRARAPG